MQITFKDGSFISINENGFGTNLNVIVCGIKSRKEVTMSSLDLDKGQIIEMADFLNEWLKKYA